MSKVIPVTQDQQARWELQDPLEQTQLSLVHKAFKESKALKESKGIPEILVLLVLLEQQGRKDQKVTQALSERPDRQEQIIMSSTRQSRHRRLTGSCGLILPK